jgi:hypothetical protein
MSTSIIETKLLIMLHVEKEFMSRVRYLRHWWTSMEWNIKGCKDVDY